MNQIQRCTRCIMDNSSDSTISFDANGVCNYCTQAFSEIGKIYFPDEKGKKKLDVMLREIKRAGAGSKYDCIMGISGGLDSSYLAYLGYKWGLRVLAVHIDDGFDTKVSKENLDKLIRCTGFTLKTIKPNAEQFYDLTLAYMKAGVPNILVPQDNVLFAFLYDQMKKNNIKYFLAGGNFALESILQRGNTYKALDVVNIKDIHKKYGKKSISDLKFLTTIERRTDVIIHGLKTYYPLNYIDYSRKKAFDELEIFCGFKYYGRKHLENVLTAFALLYWFPKKFGVDKRTSHLSSMIVSGQMTRDEALKEFEEPIYDEGTMCEYIRIICDKLSISGEEFDAIMSGTTHQHEAYKTEDETFFYRAIQFAYHIKKKVR